MAISLKALTNKLELAVSCLATAAGLDTVLVGNYHLANVPFAEHTKNIDYYGSNALIIIGGMTLSAGIYALINHYRKNTPQCLRKN